jgi:hypothetical protein
MSISARFVIRRLVSLLVLAFASLAIMVVPGYPLELDADFVWNRVLNYAHERGWQFGPELAFTYGPAGFLISPDFAPHAFGLRMLCEVALSVTVASGVCLLGWRLSVGRRAMLIGLFVWLVCSIQPRADLLLYIGLTCWALLCLAAAGRRRLVYLGVFTLLAAFCGLAKVSLLAMSGLGVLVLASELWFSGARREGWILVGAFPAALLAGWIGCGQRLANVGTFLWHALLIARSYDETMGLEGLPTLRFSGALVLVPAVVTVLVRCGTALASGAERRAWRRAVLVLWGLGLVLLAWKHGFVMTDLYHVGFFFGFIPVLVIALEILPCENALARVGSRVGVLLTCVAAVGALQWLVFPPLSTVLSAPFKAVPRNLKVLVNVQDYYRRMMGTENEVRRAYALPKLARILNQSTVDVFGIGQCSAIFNDLNYHPRPVFECYSAYSAPLMRLNEEFLLSARAPEYVLFDFNPMERRFPTLEDSMVLRALLMNYELVDSESSFLLLKARSAFPARLTRLREGTVRAGEPIQLSDFGGANLWLELEVRPTILGRIRRFFFKPPILRLVMWTQGSTARPSRFQAPAPMVRAGFIANPLLRRREDVVKFYRGEPLPQAAACSIEVNPGQEAFWQDTVGYRIYRIEAPDRL